MESGAVVFAVVFVLAPLVLFGLALVLPAMSLALGIGALFLLATGFTVGAASLPR